MIIKKELKKYKSNIHRLIFILFIFFIFGFITSENCKGQKLTNCDTLLIDSITNKYLKQFIGAQVIDFLLEDQIRNYDAILFKREPPTVISGIEVYFLNGKGAMFTIYPADVSFANKEFRWDKDKRWNIKRFLDEKIGRITFHYSHELLLVVPPY